jgi:hypothetical protein
MWKSLCQGRPNGGFSKDLLHAKQPQREDSHKSSARSGSRGKRQFLQVWESPGRTVAHFIDYEQRGGYTGGKRRRKERYLWPSKILVWLEQVRHGLRACWWVGVRARRAGRFFCESFDGLI